MTDHGPREDVRVGVCAVCGQQLLLTEADCWHPWTVRVACPPEAPDEAGLVRPAWGRPGHPGRDAWRPPGWRPAPR